MDYAIHIQRSSSSARGNLLNGSNLFDSCDPVYSHPIADKAETHGAHGHLPDERSGSGIKRGRLYSSNHSRITF